VRIEHANGWETQYCHMANGSIAVRPGQQVTAGQRLGVVGLSGQTEFPHLHFTVRQNGQAVDPFAYGAPAGACGGRGASLWAASAQGMAYKAPEVINFGFAPGPVTMADIDSGAAQASRPNAASPALVVWVRANGLEQGDEQSLMLEGPDGTVLAENVPPPLERSKAQYFLFTGKANRGGALRPGVYTGRYVVRREGRAVLEQTVQLPIG
jgi:hypothetical protein